MGLLGNGFRTDFGAGVKWGAAATFMPGNRSKRQFFLQSLNHEGLSEMLAKSANPEGSSGQSSWQMPRVGGGMAMRGTGSGSFVAPLVPMYLMIANISGSGDMAASVKGVGSMLCLMTGSSSFSADISANGNMTISMTGSSSFTVDIDAVGNMSVNFSGSGTLSADASLFLNMVCNMIGNGTLSADMVLFASMLCSMNGAGTLTADMIGQYPMSCDMDGSGDMAASIGALANMILELIGSGDLDASIGAIADMSIDMTVTGTGLTTSNVGQAVWATPLEGTYTAAEIMRLLSAIAAGKTTIIDLGGGNATVTFRDINDTVDRVEADMTNSERTNVTKDL